MATITGLPAVGIRVFLSLSAAKWYAEHVIVHRRGYLFWGAAGSGKMDLCLAISGIVGLNIYTINVASQHLTEQDYAILFRRLPQRCLLLLQNIDMLDDALVPGLVDLLVGLDAKAGRIVVLTSEERTVPQPILQYGCVDMIIPMASVTSSIARNIFLTSYASLVFLPCQSSDEDGRALSKAGTYSRAHIERLAEEFSSEIPKETFYVSDIENYLIRYRSSPEDAVINVENWTREYCGMST
ncbi:hypothetical protein BDV40DRAFT_291074 [Aspergillus tamarii]|uniref:P-loop containing nucleoside triphosphate hydrolase protein n=2 Tax=Aspergillus subgen. Circumdati TaxID=2720871 RepID=A0A5N6UMD5_ASPTM|nr:hypothetical protein BDV40DRAFT_291074 [Aspergillus tamarii]KAE8423650.1 hypothetical protein BDV36DRAFT_279162 [Aspergillus pseudocaelatus]